MGGVIGRRCVGGRVDLVLGVRRSAQDAGAVVTKIALVQGIPSLSGRGGPPPGMFG